MTRVAALAISFFLCAQAQAATIGDVDLSSLTLTRTSLLSLGGGTYEAKGVSNGIGYTYTGGLFTGFTGTTSFNDLPAGNNTFPDLHAGSVFEIVFDSAITSLLVAMRNDNRPGVMGIDFGVVASDQVDTVTNGTSTSNYRVQDLGGALVLLEFASPRTSVTQMIPATGDGFDLAFFANPLPPTPAPSPSPLWLMLGCLLVLPKLTGNLRRK